LWGALSDERAGCPVMAAGPRYIAAAQSTLKTPLPTVTPLLRVTRPLRSNGCFSGSTVLALSKYATIFYFCTNHNVTKMRLCGLYRRVGGAQRLHLQGRRVSLARNQQGCLRTTRHHNPEVTAENFQIQQKTILWPLMAPITVMATGFDSPRWRRFFSSALHPDRMENPFSLRGRGYGWGEGISLEVKRPGREAHHLPLSSAVINV
jgi:hypothetical protein